MSLETIANETAIKTDIGKPNNLPNLDVSKIAGYDSAELIDVTSFKQLHDNGYFDQFVAIYNRIPENERLSLDVFQDRVENKSGLLGSDKYHLKLAVLNGKVLGYSAGRWFSNIDTGFVSYLGTLEELERNGIGKKVRNSLLETYKQDSSSQGKDLNSIVGEIASDNETYLIRLRKRSDISFLDINYSQGAFDDLEGGVPLNLYVQALPPPDREYIGKPLFKEVEIKNQEGEMVIRSAIRKDYVKDLLSTIFEKIYKDNNSAQFHAAMKSVDKYDDYVMPFIPAVAPNHAASAYMK